MPICLVFRNFCSTFNLLSKHHVFYSFSYLTCLFFIDLLGSSGLIIYIFSEIVLTTHCACEKEIFLVFNKCFLHMAFLDHECNCIKILNEVERLCKAK